MRTSEELAAARATLELMSAANPYEPTVVPRAALRFPCRLPVPAGFDAEDASTWPRVDGRLEFYDGALWFMPPSGEDQQDTVSDVVTELTLWRRSHPEFVVGTNEAGMKLGAEVRAADVAIWRRADLGARGRGLRRVPPVLAVEVAGIDDDLADLRDKASWYLSHGVEVVWLVFPETRTVVVVTSAGSTEHGRGEQLPAIPSLPGLAPAVASFFAQVDG